jgi:hypothetical protein
VKVCLVSLPTKWTFWYNRRTGCDTAKAVCNERLTKRRGGRARLNAADSKSAIPLRVSGVRIPPSPPQSLSPLESAIYTAPIAALWPENRDSSSNQRIAFTATVPISFPQFSERNIGSSFFE